MRRCGAVMVVVLILLSGVLRAADEKPLEDARKLFLTGEYSRARQTLETMLKADASNASATVRS